MKLLLLVILLFSCGRDSDHEYHQAPLNPPEINIDEDLAPYIDMFKEDAEKYNVNLVLLDKLRVVHFVSMHVDNILGICRTYSQNGQIKYTEIQVNLNYKYRLGTIQFKGLMYHELGHCLLQKEHEEGVKIMRSSILTDYEFALYWDSLVKYLFTGEVSNELQGYHIH